MEFEWKEKKLPVSHFLISVFFITIQILTLIHWILSILVLPLFFISIYLLFFNKSSYAIHVTESNISIRPQLISYTKNFDLKKISSVLITLVKKKDGYFDGSNGRHSYTTSLYYNIKIIGINYEHAYKFKKKWYVSGLNSKVRQINAIQMRDDFENKLRYVVNQLPGLFEIQDISLKTKIKCHTKYFLLFFDLLAILGLYLGYINSREDMVIGGLILVIIITICIILPQRKYK